MTGYRRVGVVQRHEPWTLRAFAPEEASAAEGPLANQPPSYRQIIDQAAQPLDGPNRVCTSCDYGRYVYQK